MGVFNALAGDVLIKNAEPNPTRILLRIPQVLLWNWLNLLTFNVANQRLPNSVQEDSVNKPWRPLPSKRLSLNGARRLLLGLIPCCLFVINFLGGLRETAAMLILTWMYNDLGGADENYIIRNLINAGGFMCHGSGATIIAAGSEELTQSAYMWLVMIGAVIFTTLQIQDIPDMEGDAARGRLTFPLVHGPEAARWSVAFPVFIWSLICPAFWKSISLGYISSLVLGTLVGFRILTMKSVAADQKTYKIWCVWLVMLYMLPLCRDSGVVRI